MELPFSNADFLKVFKDYNQTVWPVQIALLTLGIFTVLLTVKQSGYSDKIIGLLLGSMWLWTGTVYHIYFFAEVNSAAYFFGVLFLIQSVLFIKAAFTEDEFEFKAQFNKFGIIGAIFILYSLLIYPLLSHLFEHIYPESLTFGVPCPITIFTFGILLLNKNKVPIYLVILPLIWSLIGFTAVITLRMREDAGLLVAGVWGTMFILSKNSKQVEQSKECPSGEELR